MNLKVIGALCVIVGCGSFGFLMAAQHMSQIRMYRNLISALEFMSCELRYRCTPLPELCRKAGERSQGRIRQILILLADELDAQISPDVHRCMASVLERLDTLDASIRSALLTLGSNLGKFDMAGQLVVLEGAEKLCRAHLCDLNKHKDSRIRSYQTLGLCAGAAIAILLV